MSRPASRRRAVVLPEPLSPTSTRVSPERASSAPSTTNSPRDCRNEARSSGPSFGQAGGRAKPEEEEEREQHEDDGERDRDFQVGLESDIDRERHGLRDAGKIAGEGDRGTELAQGARAGHGGPGDQRRPR